MPSYGFDKRTKLSEMMTKVMLDEILNLPPLKSFRYGIEVFPEEVHKLLEETHTENVQFIRYMPDILVIDSNNPENAYLMELKVADTGIKKESFFKKIIEKRHEMDKDIPRPYPKREGMCKEDIFNVELTAHDLYTFYEKYIDIIIVGFSTFSERGLIANYNKNLDIVSYYTPGKIGRPAVCGSYTRIANIDQRSFIDFYNFMIKKHPSINKNELRKKINKAERKLERLSKS